MHNPPPPPPPPLLPNPFFKFCSHPNFPVTSNTHPHCFFSCLVSFAEWVIITAHFTYWQLVPDLSTRRTLMCFMQQGIKFTEVWHIMWLFTGTLIWYQTRRQTQTHTAHSGTSRLTHPYKYIFTPPAMCSQQLPLLP